MHVRLGAAGDRRTLCSPPHLAEHLRGEPARQFPLDAGSLLGRLLFVPGTCNSEGERRAGR